MEETAGMEKGRRCRMVSRCELCKEEVRIGEKLLTDMEARFGQSEISLSLVNNSNTKHGAMVMLNPSTPSFRLLYTHRGLRHFDRDKSENNSGVDQSQSRIPLLTALSSRIKHEKVPEVYVMRSHRSLNSQLLYSRLSHNA